jgi:hypothetical protein
MCAPSGQSRSRWSTRRGDVERHAGCRARRQRLEVGADLVGDVAVGGDAVGADDDRVDVAARQQQAGGVVGDDGVRHAVLGFSSQAVSSPWLRGRVSETHTWTSMPASKAA